MRSYEQSIEQRFLTVMGVVRGAERPPVPDPPAPPTPLLWRLIERTRELGSSELELREGSAPLARLVVGKCELGEPPLDEERMRELVSAAVGLRGVSMLQHLGVTSRHLERDGLLVKATAMALPPNAPLWVLLRITGTNRFS